MKTPNAQQAVCRKRDSAKCENIELRNSVKYEKLQIIQ